MKKHEVEIEKVLLEHEKDTLKEIEKTYDRALKDVNKDIKELEESIKKLIEENALKQAQGIEVNETLIRSKVYQLKYQKALKRQLDRNLDVLKDEHTKTINDYMETMYKESYLTTMYDLSKEGVPVTTPINQELLIKSITYNTADIPLSKRIYDNVERTKKVLLGEISRGIATGRGYYEIARNVENALGVSMRKANQLAQNEGQRVRLDASYDSMQAAKKKGADIVKVWRATLDMKTRREHGELDQQWAELDGYFKSSKYGDVFAPKKFGVAAMDINCRCSLKSKPRWELDDDAPKMRYDNEQKKLIEVKNYKEWLKKYHDLDLDKELGIETKVVKEKITLSYDDLGQVFNLTKKDQKNTKILVDYINSQDVEPHIAKMYKNLDQDVRNGTVTVKYGKKNSISYNPHRKVNDTTITLIDLTKNKSKGAIRINLHEMTHLKDRIKRTYIGENKATGIKGIETYIFTNQKKYREAFKKISADMSDEVKQIIEEAKKVYIENEKALNDALEEINNRYNNNELSYAEYSKLFNKTRRESKEQIDIENRNLGVTGLEDIYDALSGGKYRDNGTVRYGHGSSYYSRDEQNGICETLANYVEMCVTNKELVELLKRDKPELVTLLDEIIMELTNE